jgi:DNA helicase-2/ATP-dependent DNA helicase PcrA
VLAFFRAHERAPLAVRMLRLQQWVIPETRHDELEADAKERDSVRAPGAPPSSIAVRHAIERTVLRARRELLDVSAAWAELLTDHQALRDALDRYAPGQFDAEDLRTAHAWFVDKCGAVVGEVEQRREDLDREREEKREQKKEREPRRPSRPSDGADRVLDEDLPAASAKLVARKRGGGDDDQDDDDEADGDDDRSVGIDGAIEVQAARLDREDDALLLRIVQRLRGPLVRGKERLRYEHILIDEAQDLSPVELAVVLGCSTKARSVTMAGDVAQRLHMDNGFEGWPQLLEAIRPRRPGENVDAEPIAIEPLRVQYRSTHPIIELSQQVLGPLADPESGNAIRGGAPVELFRFSHNGEAVAFLGEALRELMQSEPRASIALIARYPEQADVYYRGLINAEVPHLRRIAEQDFPFKPGIDVTDVRQVKGLEFDYVVLLEVSRASYPVNDESRHLLHIAATRAAHQLWVTTSGEPSLLLPESLRDRAY